MGCQIVWLHHLFKNYSAVQANKSFLFLNPEMESIRLMTEKHDEQTPNKLISQQRSYITSNTPVCMRIDYLYVLQQACVISLL